MLGMARMAYFFWPPVPGWGGTGRSRKVQASRSAGGSRIRSSLPGRASVKRLVLVAVLCGVGMLVPTMASAAVKQIVANENGSTYCITVDNGPTAVTFTVRAPGGGVLFTKQITTPVAGT